MRTSLRIDRICRSVEQVSTCGEWRRGFGLAQLFADLPGVLLAGNRSAPSSHSAAEPEIHLLQR
eukprot:scaffold447_cov307-Pinguiococcus_pyrenoidosus.AAC.7